MFLYQGRREMTEMDEFERKMVENEKDIFSTDSLLKLLKMFFFLILFNQCRQFQTP